MSEAAVALIFPKSYHAKGYPLRLKRRLRSVKVRQGHLPALQHLRFQGGAAHLPVVTKVVRVGAMATLLFSAVLHSLEARAAPSSPLPSRLLPGDYRLEGTGLFRRLIVTDRTVTYESWQAAQHGKLQHLKFSLIPPEEHPPNPMLGQFPDDLCRMFFRLIRLRRERRDDYAKSRNVSVNPTAARNKRASCPLSI